MLFLFDNKNKDGKGACQVSGKIFARDGRKRKIREDVKYEGYKKKW